jgi:hypothetical protein
MTQHDDICFLPVPEGAFNIRINSKYNWLTCCKMKGVVPFFQADLPPGHWRHIGLHSQMDEAKAREVVEHKPYGNLDRWKNYSEPGSIEFSALASYASLVKSLNLTGEFAVLKKITP